MSREFQPSRGYESYSRKDEFLPGCIFFVLIATLFYWLR